MKKIFLLGGLIFLVLAAFLFLVFSFRSKPATITNPAVDQTPKSNFNLQPIPTTTQNVFNVLLLGTGDPGHEGVGLTDSIMIIHLDIPNKKVALISIPRDLWISSQKINKVYLSGGFPLVEQAIGTITGLPISNSILIDFNGFTQAIDNIGGIEVNVPKTFDDYYYPIAGKELENCGMSNEQLAAINATLSGFQLEKQYACRYEHLHFDAGKNKMDGQTALKFVRSRHSDQDGNDFARTQRQQALIIGIKDKLLSLDALKKAPSFFDKFIRLVKTDLDKQTTIAIANLIINPKEYQTSQVVLSTTNVLKESTSADHQYILLPKSGDNNWSEIQNYIKNQIQ